MDNLIEQLRLTPEEMQQAILQHLDMPMGEAIATEAVLKVLKDERIQIKEGR